MELGQLFSKRFTSSSRSDTVISQQLRPFNPITVENVAKDYWNNCNYCAGPGKTDTTSKEVLNYPPGANVSVYFLKSLLFGKILYAQGALPGNLSDYGLRAGVEPVNRRAGFLLRYVHRSAYYRSRPGCPVLLARSRSATMARGFLCV